MRWEIIMENLFRSVIPYLIAMAIAVVFFVSILFSVASAQDLCDIPTNISRWFIDAAMLGGIVLAALTRKHILKIYGLMVVAFSLDLTVKDISC